MQHAQGLGLGEVALAAATAIFGPVVIAGIVLLAASSRERLPGFGEICRPAPNLVASRTSVASRGTNAPQPLETAVRPNRKP